MNGSTGFERHDPSIPVTIRRIGADEADIVMGATELFDHVPNRAWTEQFLVRGGHHLLIASVDGIPAGFASGIEIGHPDKPLEMLLYELGVDEGFRRRGIGSALAGALRDLAALLGCRAMWVPLEPGNEAAIATYRAAGADDEEPAAVMTWQLHGTRGAG